MYLFKATYYNKDLLEDIEEAIQIDTAGVDMTEREVYILAMEKAYDKSVEIWNAEKERDELKKKVTAQEKAITRYKKFIAQTEEMASAYNLYVAGISEEVDE